MAERIGVYVCHCGTNIAGVVDVAQVVEHAAALKDVVLAKEYVYMCSDPGQAMIQEDIAEHGLTRVVVASCSPLMHEPTFRRTLAKAGLNAYLLQMANIREQVSWVTEANGAATEKARRVVAAAINRVRQQVALEQREVPVNPDAMVVGAGIAGIEAALTLAESGKHVYLVEKSPSIGGHMAQFDKTFPTLDCAACILTPKMVAVGQHPNIDLLTYSEVEEVNGYVGNFTVRVKKHPRYIDETKCTGCGECTQQCPVDVLSEFDEGLTTRKAVYRSFPQAVPNAFVIDKKLSPCKATCPAGTNVGGYVTLIAQKKFKEALELVKRSNPFPAICGRVCHRPCEKECSRAKVDDSLGIAYLKRFVGDYEMILEDGAPPPPDLRKDEKVAIVGAGPAGLTCADRLAQMGYKVTVFEALPIKGGMLVVGIPAFRLSRAVLNREIQYIEQRGVEIKENMCLGRDFTLDDLSEQGYKAVFLAMGCHSNRKLGIPGEGLEGVVPAIDFLRDVNLGKEVVLGSGEAFVRDLDLTTQVRVGEKIVVIGGGNAALDTARTALRLGAAEVTIVYRRSRVEMPAEPEWEIDETEREGVKIEYLVAPARCIGRGGHLAGVELQRMKLGEPGADGRRRPEPIPGSEFVLDCDMLLPAIGQVPDQRWMPPDIECDPKSGTAKVDDVSLATSRPGVFAGGDVVVGPDTVIVAIGQGKQAATSIDRYLRGLDLREGREPAPKPLAEVDTAHVAHKSRVPMPMLPLAKREWNFDEVELGYTEEQAVEEASRCLKCGVCVECLECEKLCELGAIHHDMEPETLEVDVGAIVVATGFSLFDSHRAKPLGYGQYDNVLTSLEFERLSHASGPTGGKIMLKDGREPESVAIIHCVGSRDENYNEYCSRVCCMYGMKFAHLVREKTEADVYEFYIDIRAFGKGYEEFYDRLMSEDVIFIRGKGAEVTNVAETPAEEGKLIVKCEDTLLGLVRRVPVDMVVLCGALEPRSDAAEVAKMFSMSCADGGFFLEQHPKLAPVSTSTDGVFIAGACQGPKDIPDAVAQGAAAAGKANELLDTGLVRIEPITSTIDEDFCSGCQTCIPLCASTAISFDEEKKVSVIEEALCKGCGTCVAACPAGAAQQNGFADAQIFAEIEGALMEPAGPTPHEALADAAG